MLEQDECELLDFLLTESGRPVTFLALFHRDDIPEACAETLRHAAPLIARARVPQTSPLPLTREVNMRNPFSFAAFPSGTGCSPTSRRRRRSAVYADPAFRNQFREDLKNPTGFSNWGRINVHEVKNPALKALEGQPIADIAQEQGKDGVDTFLDLTLPTISTSNSTWPRSTRRDDRMSEILNDKSILIALGDGGAHVDMLCDAGYPTYLLGTWVREHQAMTLEEGVRTPHLRSGRSVRHQGPRPPRPGAPADIAIFDPGRIGSANRGERRYDLPGGAKRMVMPSRGVEYTIVNGAIDLGAGQAHRSQSRQGAARARAISVPMEPRSHGRHLSHRPAGRGSI